MQLRQYQKDAIEALYKYFRDGNTGHPICVAPTGSGKSLIIAHFIYNTILQWPDQRLIVASHVKEIIEQDFAALRKLWPHPDAGIFSASLNSRRHMDAVTFCTVQSVCRKPEILGERNIFLLDEAHLLAPKADGQYRKLIDGLHKINPSMRVIGFTASPYRLGQGYLTQGKDALFTDIAYDISVKRLLAEGFLCPLTAYQPKDLQADISKIRITAGEYNTDDMVAEFDHLINPVAKDIAAKTRDRSSVIMFCPRVDTCHKMRAALHSNGIYSVEVVTGETPGVERDRILADFKAGNIRALLSVGVLTTGFDAPNVDCVVLFRATMSPGLYYQMLGRGMRLFPHKSDCLVLDYGGNIERHGPVTNIIPPVPPKEKKTKPEPRIMLCPECDFVIELPRPERCPACDCVLPKEEMKPDVSKYSTRAVDADPLYDAPPKPAEWVDVQSVDYKRHHPPGKEYPTLWVTYYTEFEKFSEWMCFEHPEGSFPHNKAKEWWSRVTGGMPTPDTVDKALEISHGFLVPKRIKVKQDGKYWRILDYEH